MRDGGFARCILKLVYLPIRFLATTKISSLAPARKPRSNVLNRTPLPFDFLRRTTFGQPVPLQRTRTRDPRGDCTLRTDTIVRVV